MAHQLILHYSMHLRSSGTHISRWVATWWSCSQAAGRCRHCSPCWPGVFSCSCHLLLWEKKHITTHFQIAIQDKKTNYSILVGRQTGNIFPYRKTSTKCNLLFNKTNVHEIFWYSKLNKIWKILALKIYIRYRQFNNTIIIRLSKIYISYPWN